MNFFPLDLLFLALGVVGFLALSGGCLLVALYLVGDHFSAPRWNKRSRMA